VQPAAGTLTLPVMVMRLDWVPETARSGPTGTPSSMARIAPSRAPEIMFCAMSAAPACGSRVIMMPTRA